MGKYQTLHDRVLDKAVDVIEHQRVAADQQPPLDEVKALVGRKIGVHRRDIVRERCGKLHLGRRYKRSKRISVEDH